MYDDVNRGWRALWLPTVALIAGGVLGGALAITQRNGSSFSAGYALAAAIVATVAMLTLLLGVLVLAAERAEVIDLRERLDQYRAAEPIRRRVVDGERLPDVPLVGYLRGDGSYLKLERDRQP